MHTTAPPQGATVRPGQLGSLTAAGEDTLHQVVSNSTSLNHSIHSQDEIPDDNTETDG